MTKYSDFYRIESTRLQRWNYAGPFKYFITACTRCMENYFGEIINGEMVKNSLGNEVDDQWLLTPAIRPDMNISLDVFQVMPNHFHGIIEIGWNRYNNLLFRPITTLDQEHPTSCRDAMHGVSTGSNSGNNKFGPQRKNLGSVMRGFKSSVTTFARKNKILFDWQPRYFDVLIRDDKTLEKIRRYILNNVKNWDRDRFNKN